MSSRAVPQQAPAPARTPVARLLLSRPGDPEEREAERLSDAAGPTRVSRAHPALRGDPAAPHVAGRLRALAGRGTPLPGAVREPFEAMLGHDFSRVRVHTDSAADDAARGLGALAFALGNDIGFASGRFAPETPAGRRLLAHELVHVAQQWDAPACVARASYGRQVPNSEGRLELEDQELIERPREDEEVAVVRRQHSGGTGTGTGGAAPGALAAPTLSLTPAATLTRGDTLTASLAFTPASGERLRVNRWNYRTPAHGTVVRPSSDAGFQSSWSGVMAVSGEIVLIYQIIPAGGRAGAAQLLPTPVTVADRTGPLFVSTPTLDPEGTLTGQPTPPERFRQLGRHNVARPTLPALTTSPIAGGPNAGLTFVSALTAGTYTSTPRIHPDETTPTSAFYRFHLDPSRLYFVPTTGARVLIPLTEYSALSISGGTLTFAVPSWDAFYKAHNVFRVRAVPIGGGAGVVLSNAQWRLASNTRTANIQSVDPAVVRGLLGIGARDPFGVVGTALGGWRGFRLMQSPAIVAGVRSHEYVHPVHSHRANFVKMLRALDPQRKIESTVSAPAALVNFVGRLGGWWAEIIRPDHQLVDEAASLAAERFVAAPSSMAEVNVDPATRTPLGSVWNITGDQEMT